MGLSTTNIRVILAPSLVRVVHDNKKNNAKRETISEINMMMIM